MSRLRRSARAEADLLDIWDHISPTNPESAATLLRRIDAICQKLADHPEMGARRDEAAPGLRLFPVDRYLVLYRAGDGEVEILRVLHGARQWKDLL